MTRLNLVSKPIPLLHHHHHHHSTVAAVRDCNVSDSAIIWELLRSYGGGGAEIRHHQPGGEEDRRGGRSEGGKEGGKHPWSSLHTAASHRRPFALWATLQTRPGSSGFDSPLCNYHKGHGNKLTDEAARASPLFFFFSPPSKCREYSEKLLVLAVTDAAVWRKTSGVTWRLSWRAALGVRVPAIAGAAN